MSSDYFDKQVLSVTYLPPLESPLIIDGSVDTKREPFEPPEHKNEGGYKHVKDDPFCAFLESFGSEDKVVKKVCEHENSKVEGGELKRF